VRCCGGCSLRGRVHASRMPAWRLRRGGPGFVPPARRASDPVLNGRAPRAPSHFVPRRAATSRPAPPSPGPMPSTLRAPAARIPTRRHRDLGTRNTGRACRGKLGRADRRPSLAGVQQRPSSQSMAPHRRDGSTAGAGHAAASATTSARPSFRSSVSAPAASTADWLIAWQREPSRGECCLVPSKQPPVFRAPATSPAGGRVAFRAAGARSVERMVPRGGGAGREVSARRGTK
jgi:hypothetical protein